MTVQHFGFEISVVLQHDK